MDQNSNNNYHDDGIKYIYIPEEETDESKDEIEEAEIENIDIDVEILFSVPAVKFETLSTAGLLSAYIIRGIQTDELLASMDNIPKKDSNLPVNIWISQRFYERTPVIFVQKSFSENFQKDDFFIITIEDKPRIYGETGIINSEDITRIKEYVVLNKNLLLAYWNQDIDDTSEVLHKLRPVENK